MERRETGEKKRKAATEKRSDGEMIWFIHVARVLISTGPVLANLRVKRHFQYG